jgi:hypothetical protein
MNTITGAIDRDDNGMMDRTIDDGSGDNLVPQIIAKGFKADFCLDTWVHFSVRWH